MGRVLCIATALACASLCFAADLGREDAGLRIEANLSPPSASRDLVVVLKNVSSSPISVFVGLSQRVTNFFFEFSATAPDGTQIQVWKSPEAFNPGIGYLAPVMLDLSPHATHEYRFPLKQLIWIKQGVDANLETLLQKGYTAHVSLEAQQPILGFIQSRSDVHLWTGHVVSDEIRAAR